MNRQSLLALAFAALLATSGCAALQSLGGGNAAAAPEENVSSAFESLETLSATQVSTLRHGNTTNHTRTVIRASFGDPPKQYSRVLAPESREGDVSLVNASATILYDASTNEVTRIPQSGSGSRSIDRGEYYASIVAAARNDSTVSSTSRGVSPLPVVPASKSGTAVPTDEIEGYEVDYLGTETVSGRTAYGFRMTPASDAAFDVNQTVWLDAEYYFPLETNQTTTINGSTYHVHSTLENVTFNADLPPDAFSFDPPADATVDTLNVSTETYESLDAARADADLSVPEPDVPGGYTFEQAQRLNGNFTQLSVQYTNEAGARIVVSKAESSANGSDGAFDLGENVTVAGHDGTYVATSRSSLVTFSCSDVQYSVTASDLDRAELLDVAASVACE